MEHSFRTYFEIEEPTILEQIEEIPEDAATEDNSDDIDTGECESILPCEDTSISETSIPDISESEEGTTVGTEEPPDETILNSAENETMENVAEETE